jgi:glycosyltransferase involved in cell wall biosynthesis
VSNEHAIGETNELLRQMKDMAEVSRSAGNFDWPGVNEQAETSMARARIAIVHDWFEGYSGSERVVEQIIALFPSADLFGIVDFLPEASRHFLGGRTIKTTFLQNVPAARHFFRYLLPLMAVAVESIDLSDYDIVISSSHALAKGVLTGPDQLHICYCHSPMRYAWDLQHQYLSETKRGGVGLLAARAMLHYMRLWDHRTANGVDHFVANSRYIARRIMKVYGRQSSVIYPPVDVDSFALKTGKDPFYLAASRLVPYKRMSVIVEAFAAMPDKKLVIIGDGPMLKTIRGIATRNVEVLGYQPFSVLRDYMQRAHAFIFAAEEDFGIMPVEAQACGTPVLCYDRGGTVESVIDGETGLFFSSQTPEAIKNVVQLFESCANHFSASTIRANAERFTKEKFAVALRKLVGEQYREHLTRCPRRPQATKKAVAAAM